MKLETYKCDKCGKEKGLVNHWYAAQVRQGNGGGIYVISFARWLKIMEENPYPEEEGSEFRFENFRALLWPSLSIRVYFYEVAAMNFSKKFATKFFQEKDL